MLATRTSSRRQRSQAYSRNRTRRDLVHEYAEVNGQRLHYAKIGRGPRDDLPARLSGVLAVSGRASSPSSAAITRRSAPDLRGYNLSSKPPEVADYAVPNIVADVHALATALLKSTGGSKFTLVAHDWGGVAAWVYAAQTAASGRSALVILNAPHPSLFGRELRENPAQQKASEPSC